MTESKGPDNQDRAVPGKKKRKSPLHRLRPYAVGIVAMVVVFGGSALIGEHVRATKDDKVKNPSDVVGAATLKPGVTPDPGQSPRPDQDEKLQIPVHPTVPVTLTVYEDLRSPDSKAFAEEYQATFDQLLSTGQVQLHYQLVTASDRGYGGKGSLMAANAAACAQDQSRFTQYVQQIWDHQPDPHGDGLAGRTLLKKLARETGGIMMGKFEPCMEQGDHNGWVKKSQADYAALGLGQVPALEINNVAVKNVHTSLTPKKLRAMVLKEAKRVVAAQATASPTPTLLGD
ncbi:MULTISPECIES: DsbA family protein [unclassified Streptomyces]|uniref:DsbA family protein n=1 Tax=unclassified Streptomyces TaxID=2593676 RepID=UPI002E286A88|nr:thioredoxin domain-containing protein [Streptomyces sp. NBC_00223]